MKIKDFINYLYPKNIKCIICEAELSHNTHYSICDKCMDSLPFIVGKVCVKCGDPIKSDGNYCLHCKNDMPLFKMCRSPFIYRDPIRHMVRNLKYDNKRYLAETLSNFVVSEFVKMGVDVDMVVPVPISEHRLKVRGYNQAELLCSAFVEKLHLDVRTDVLLKVKETSSQAYLTRQEREKNLEDVFKVSDKKLVKDKTILLVDDVFTTGTTLNECTKVLLHAGAKAVYCVTLAHADKHRDDDDNVKKRKSVFHRIGQAIKPNETDMER